MEIAQLDSIDVNSEDERGRTPLMHAVTYCRIEIVKCILEKDVDINHQDNFGETALILSTIFDFCYDITRLLLVKGADINLKSTSNKSALWWAAVSDKVYVVRLLCWRGAKCHGIWPKTNDTINKILKIDDFLLIIHILPTDLLRDIYIYYL
jgi:ankyrin repeat protein